MISLQRLAKLTTLSPTSPEITPTERITALLVMALEFVRDKPESIDLRAWGQQMHEALERAIGERIPGEILERPERYLIEYAPAMFANESGWTFFRDGLLVSGNPLEWAAAKWREDHDAAGNFRPREQLPWQAWLYMALVEDGLVADTPDGLLAVAWYSAHGATHPDYWIPGTAANAVRTAKAEAIAEWTAIHGQPK